MEPNRRKTIQDIADKANVSKSTVSRVLTGSTRVAEDKRAAVLSAMAELDYQPNIFARGLAGGQSLTVGVLTQNFGSPFYDAILRGILQGFNGSDHSPIFVDGRWQPEIEREAMQTLLDRRVDGLIVVGGLAPLEILTQIAEQLPLIVVGRRIPTMESLCLFVDNQEAAYNATRYLIEAGHRQIAHIAGDPSHDDTRDRCRGYLDALEDAGIAPKEDLIVEGDFRSHSGVMAVEMLLARGQTFSAIFAANDQMAIGARLALFRRSIRVPDDVSMIGFDDHAASAYMIPPLTTVRQPAEEMGDTAARAMLHQLRNEPFEIPKFSTQLVIRESVARFL